MPAVGRLWPSVNDDGVAGAAGAGVADDGYDLDPDSFPPGPVCLPDPAHN